MKLESNWKTKTLENLERNIWPPLSSDEGSYLIKTCNRLRKKALAEFDIEDLRIMINENIGLKYLIPLALEILNKNILAEGNYYEGDLLSAVLSSDKSYWEQEKDSWKTVIDLYERNETLINDFDTSWEIKKKLKGLYNNFKSLN